MEMKLIKNMENTNVRFKKRKLETAYDLIYCHFHYFLLVCVCVKVSGCFP